MSSPHHAIDKFFNNATSLKVNHQLSQHRSQCHSFAMCSVCPLYIPSQRKFAYNFCAVTKQHRGTTHLDICALSRLPGTTTITPKSTQGCFDPRSDMRIQYRADICHSVRPCEFLVWHICAVPKNNTKFPDSTMENLRQDVLRIVDTTQLHILLYLTKAL